MLTRLRNRNGFTLVEVLICFMISLFIFLSLIGGLLAIKSVGSFARHHIQAMNVVRGAVEGVRATAYDNVVNSSSTETYSAGSDGVFGTADDLTGTLDVSVVDAMDMDADGNVTEADGTGFFSDMMKPVRVEFTWQEHLLGVPRNTTVTVDTLVSR